MQQSATSASMQNPSLKAPRHKIVWFGHEFNIWMYRPHSNSGHPFLISSDNLHDKVTQRSGRHDPSMVIIRYQTFRLWTCRSISHANNSRSCPFHVSFVRCRFTCIVFSLPFCFHSFHCSFHFPFVCVCASMQFPVIFFWFCSCFIMFLSIHFIFLHVPFISPPLPPLPPFSQC